MNNIKTALRSKLGSRTLRNLMVWHRMARKVEENGTLGTVHLPCSDVPVMEIVAEFRRMATGPNGRNHHRLWAPPKYEYEKRRTQAAKETIAKALMAQMPVLSDKAA